MKSSDKLLSQDFDLKKDENEMHFCLFGPVFSLSIFCWFLVASLFLRKEIIYSSVRLLSNFLWEQIFWGEELTIRGNPTSKLRKKRRTVWKMNLFFSEYLTWIYFPGRLARISMLVSDLFEKICPTKFLMSASLSSFFKKRGEVEVVGPAIPTGELLCFFVPASASISTLASALTLTCVRSLSPKCDRNF